MLNTTSIEYCVTGYDKPFRIVTLIVIYICVLMLFLAWLYLKFHLTKSNLKPFKLLLLADALHCLVYLSSQHQKRVFHVGYPDLEVDVLCVPLNCEVASFFGLTAYFLSFGAYASIAYAPYMTTRSMLRMVNNSHVSQGATVWGRIIRGRLFRISALISLSSAAVYSLGRFQTTIGPFHGYICLDSLREVVAVSIVLVTLLVYILMIWFFRASLTNLALIEERSKSIFVFTTSDTTTIDMDHISYINRAAGRDIQVEIMTKNAAKVVIRTLRVVSRCLLVTSVPFVCIVALELLLTTQNPGFMRKIGVLVFLSRPIGDVVALFYAVRATLQAQVTPSQLIEEATLEVPGTLDIPKQTSTEVSMFESTVPNFRS